MPYPGRKSRRRLADHRTPCGNGRRPSHGALPRLCSAGPRPTVVLVLRCRGCGELVSEFAARCPECHASTDDAEELPIEPAPAQPPPVAATPVAASAAAPPPPQLSPQHPRQPLSSEPNPPASDLPPAPDLILDQPETADPSPQSHRRRVAAIVVAVAIAALAALIVSTTATSGPGRAPSAAQILAGLNLSGQVVSDINGTIVVSDPDGSRQAVMPPVSPLGSDQTVNLSPSLDAGYLATPRGDVISARGLRLDRIAVAATFPNGYTAQPDPFAFDDRALVILSHPVQSPATTEVSVVSLVDGQTTTLGPADEAAGDPQTLGAFVSIAEVPQPAGAPFPEGRGADSRVDLFEANSASVVLATTGQLDAELGQNRDQPAALTVFPDRAGDKVAVEVNPIDVGNSDAGLVVLDRTGQVLAAVPPSSGPVQNSQPAWSPDGESLAYYMFGQRGAEIGVWHLGGHVTVRPAPDPGDSFLTCLWSPGGSDILCPASQGATDESSLWVLGAAKGGPLVEVPAPGLPEVWLPASSY